MGFSTYKFNISHNGFLPTAVLFWSDHTGDTGSCWQRWRVLSWIKLPHLLTPGCCLILPYSALHMATWTSHRS